MAQSVKCFPCKPEFNPQNLQFKKKIVIKLRIVAGAGNPSTTEAEANRSFGFAGHQPSRFNRLKTKERPSLKELNG